MMTIQMPSSSLGLFRSFVDEASILGVTYDVPLGACSTLKAGGRAACVLTPKGIEDLVAFRQWNISQPEPLKETIVGGLSNILIRDGGLEGVVIRLPATKNWVFEDDLFIFDAAVPNFYACEAARHLGFSGLEFLAGIPGRIGGAIAMNAGAYGSDISQNLVWMELLTKEGQILKKIVPICP